MTLGPPGSLSPAHSPQLSSSLICLLVDAFLVFVTDRNDCGWSADTIAQHQTAHQSQSGGKSSFSGCFLRGSSASYGLNPCWQRGRGGCNELLIHPNIPLSGQNERVIHHNFVQAGIRQILWWLLFKYR